MENKLKENIDETKSFHYPREYETMSIEKALDFLDLARDGHDLLFTPCNYYGFLSLLVLKCGVDIDYAFGPDFVEDAEEIKKHLRSENFSLDELQNMVNQRIQEVDSKSHSR